MYGEVKRYFTLIPMLIVCYIDWRVRFDCEYSLSSAKSHNWGALYQILGEYRTTTSKKLHFWVYNCDKRPMRHTI